MWWNEKFKRWVNHTKKKKKIVSFDEEQFEWNAQVEWTIRKGNRNEGLEKEPLNKDRNANWEKGKSWEKVPVEWRKISTGAWVDNSLAMGRGLRGSAMAYWTESFGEDDGWTEPDFEDGWGGWGSGSAMVRGVDGEDDGWMELGFEGWWIGSAMVKWQRNKRNRKMGEEWDDGSLESYVFEKERMSVKRQRNKRNKKKKEINIILMREKIKNNIWV